MQQVVHSPSHIHRFVNYRFGFSIIVQKNWMIQIVLCVLALADGLICHNYETNSRESSLTTSGKKLTKCSDGDIVMIGNFTALVVF